MSVGNDEKSSNILSISTVLLVKQVGARPNGHCNLQPSQIITGK